MANIWHDLNPHRIHCDDFIAVIEIEKGSKNKYETMKEPLAQPRHQKYKTNFFKKTWAPASVWFLRLTPQNSTHILKFLLLQKAIFRHLQNAAPPHLFHVLKAKDNWTKISFQGSSLLQFKLENTAQYTFLKTILQYVIF